MNAKIKKNVCTIVIMLFAQAQLVNCQNYILEFNINDFHVTSINKDMPIQSEYIRITANDSMSVLQIVRLDSSHVKNDQISTIDFLNQSYSTPSEAYSMNLNAFKKDSLDHSVLEYGTFTEGKITGYKNIILYKKTNETRYMFYFYITNKSVQVSL